MDVTYLDCCGVKELSGIQEENDPKETLRRLYQGDNMNSLDYLSGRFFIFTQADTLQAGQKFRDEKYGKKLAAFIKKHRLGSVKQCGSGVNPNSQNRVMVWVWRLNEKAFAAWGKRQKFEPLRDPYYDEPYPYDPFF